MTDLLAAITVVFNYGRDACDLFSSPKDTLHIFSMLIFMAVSNTSSSSVHLKHGTLRNKYMSLEIEEVF